ncbi:DNA-processing protein DprA [Marinomonas sp. 2405UD66-6]|uniref:DNA-processing protein DprA n=1 Tax=Marinomonas sp. 2405UD66-6 TaxID=3391834 RepID=UPI0039C9481A
MENSRLTGLTKTDWLCFSFLEGIGPARLSRLYTYLNQLQKHSSDQELMTQLLFEDDQESGRVLSYELLRALKWPEITARQAMDYLSSGILSNEQKQKRDDTLAWLEAENHHLILQEDNDYPEELKEINVAPAFFYLEGNREALTHPKIGIVGARKCTRYGRDVTFQFAKKLSDYGVCVVSGGAMGIDTAAHQGALESQKTPTIVVAGTGLLHRYPNRNLPLFEQVLKQGGAIISEYPLTTSPRPHLFPPRNRIISGLSMGVLVAEASIKSGSLISASYAVQQNREVFALPGRLPDPQSEGCHQLLRQGATLVRSVEDILDECSPIRLVTSSTSRKESNKGSEILETKKEHTLALVIPSLKPLSDKVSDEARLVAALLEKEAEAMDFDMLIRQTKLNAGVMMQVLMELELLGCIDNREGLYSRC